VVRREIEANGVAEQVTSGIAGKPGNPETRSPPGAVDSFNASFAARLDFELTED
jgi:hypothetical protein